MLSEQQPDHGQHAGGNETQTSMEQTPRGFYITASFRGSLISKPGLSVQPDS